jgi:p-hydroxybenzoate 3-monooxygenase
VRARTQVAIIGAGPAGLLLSQLLHLAGVASVVLEQRSRDRVLQRVRAGVLEHGTVEVLDAAGVGERMRREGLIHHGFSLGLAGEAFRIDLVGLTCGKSVMVYGQTEVARDLMEAIDARGGEIVFEAEKVGLHDIDSAAPFVTWGRGEQTSRLDCDFIAGCDGSHGVSRAAIPLGVVQTFERVYPFGWLGILADVPPCADELIYANHERGFALASMRSRMRSRYYVQCGEDENLDQWPDARLWDEIERRLGPTAAAGLTRGPAIEKSIAPLRSFVCEPMRHGRLFLAGDAAHIVPPTGAKGLNLAVSDVKLLASALGAFFDRGDEVGLMAYGARALERVWKTERFSWWLTGLTHRFPLMDAFDRRMQAAELDYIRGSAAAQTMIAENYVGLSDPALT